MYLTLNLTINDLFVEFIHDTWEKVFDFYIPVGWYQPGYIFIKNNDFIFSVGKH